jgi:L-2,4-diaminobutyrate decarboxylase
MIDPVRDAYDPETMRELGRRVVDRLADYLGRATRGEIPVLPFREPDASLLAFPAAFAAAPGGQEAVEDLIARTLEASHHLHHPRYVGHQVSSPLPASAITGLVGALLNNGMAVYEMGPAATALERAVLRFFSDRLGFGLEADGVLTSGGSAGNLTALLAARQAKAGFDVWREGDAGGPPLAVLVSDEAHYSVRRATQILGWGAAGCEPVPTDTRYRLRPDALAATRASAERRGRRVIGVVASACSTRAGAFDPLEPIADFCETHDLWLHVDGAHGAAATLSRRYRSLVAGIERADSVVWDAHKMMMVPALATAVLFRDGRRAYEAFAQRADYLFDADDPRERWFDTGTRTLECTKRMMGLDIYAALVALGTDALDDYVTATFDLARRFAVRLAALSDFEIATEPMANIVCFRHRPEGVANEALDALQAKVRDAIIKDGGFYLVQTKLAGRLYLRTTIINPLTTDQDLEALIHRVREVAAKLTS